MTKLYLIIAKVLETSEKSLSDKTSLEDMQVNDSFSWLMLFSELEEQFKVKFSMDDMMNAKTIKDLKNILKKHGVSDASC